MTLNEFLKLPSACIILESVEDFKFLQKEFCKRNICWCNGKSFSDANAYLEKDESYPVYITNALMWWGFCEGELFEKINTKIDLDSIDDFYDERLTIQEFVNLPSECAIHVPEENQTLKLLDRFDMLGKVTKNGKPYNEYISDHNIQPYSDKTRWSNKGTYGSDQSYSQAYEFDDINFDITLTDFLNKNKGNGLRVIHCTTKEQAQLVFDAINKNKSCMDGCPIQDNIWYTNRGTYSSMKDCYSNMKDPDGSYNISFAPIYEFEEVDLSR